MEIVQCKVNCTFKNSFLHEPVIKPKPNPNPNPRHHSLSQQVSEGDRGVEAAVSPPVWPAGAVLRHPEPYPPVA